MVPQNEQVRQMSYQCDELRKIIGRKESDLIELREFASLENGNMCEIIAENESKDELIESMKFQLEEARRELETLRRTTKEEGENVPYNNNTLSQHNQVCMMSRLCI
jgi:bifunctional DNA-binding transcriptional regulator/antitoxin component of YhaV-PrlF toxin-antitoxin module